MMVSLLRTRYLAKNIAQVCSEPIVGYKCSAKRTPHANPFLQESSVPRITPENHGDFLIDTSKAHTPNWGAKNMSRFKDGDPFLIKLKEIDHDLRKFDDLLSKSNKAKR